MTKEIQIDEYLKLSEQYYAVEEPTEIYDLEERTFRFAKRVREWIKKVPKTISNIEDCIQLTKCSGSVAANYIEANNSISQKDFGFRIKICRKESKESKLFLRLIDCQDEIFLEEEKTILTQEAQELVLIFAAILRKLGEIK